MKKLFLLLSGIVWLFVITGCTTVKRFKSARYIGQDNTLVAMDLFGSRLSTDGSEDPEKNLWDLSASAQTQLIQILNERYPDNSQFIHSLNNSYLSPGGISMLDFTRQKLRMVFTVSKSRNYRAINQASSRFTPADRIEYLEFTLEIPESYNLHFTSWDRYVTEYGELEIADVSFTRSFDLDAESSPDQFSDAGGRGLMSRSEEQEVRTRYLKLNGSMSERKIRVEEEGTREIDLTGNIMADVSLEFEGFPERIAIPLFAGEGMEGDRTPTVAALRFVDVVVPRIEEAPDSIEAVLTFEYIYRHVQSGWKTFQEWDDQVEYYSGRISRSVTLFSRQEYVPLFYRIGTDTGSEESVKFRRQDGKEYLLQFKDYSDASRFMEWLESMPSRGKDSIAIGNTQLLYQQEPLTPERFTDAPLKVAPVF